MLDVLYVPLALLATWCLWRVPGIPMTHDAFGLQIVECYKRAYLAHDFVPTWFTFTSNGRGSALPMLYHRLHGQLFGLLALAVGSTLATKLSIPICLTIGGAGMRRLAREHRVRDAIAWASGLFLVTSPYALADWFTRGAVAELFAFMLVPWAMLALVRTLRGTTSGVWFGVATALLFYAHMLAFYFFGYLVAAATIHHVVRSRHLGWRALRKPLVQLAIGCAVLAIAIGPYVAAMEYVINLSAIAEMKMRPDAAAYLKMREYFVDSHWRWTYVAKSGEMTVEIGRWVVLSLGALLVLERRGARAVWRDLAWLAIPAIVFLALQPQEMAFVFEKIPGAAKIQFPLRLLVYIVPAAILCLAVVAEHAFRHGGLPVRASALALLATASAGQLNLTAQAQKYIRTESVTQEKIDAALASDDPMAVKLAVYASWEDFVPGRRKAPPDHAPLVDAGHCTLSSAQLLGTTQSAKVYFARHFRSTEFTIHGHDCEVKLSQFQSAIIDVQLSKPGHVTEASDGTFSISAPEDDTVVRVRDRSFVEMGARWIKQAFHLVRIVKPND